MPPPSESIRAWHVRWVASRAAKGNTSIRDDKSRYQTHVDPLIGEKPMASVTRSDIEGVVEALDGMVRAGELSWHTAWNTWAVVSKMFRDASTAKQRDLRVRDDNPCDRVAPPDRGVRRAKQFLFPSELVALFECPRVALEWRRLIAIAVYLHPRAGELEALEWEDINLDRAIVHIHRGTDRERGGTKGTKTGIARRFGLEPAILPLLRKMHAEAVGWVPLSARCLACATSPRACATSCFKRASTVTSFATPTERGRRSPGTICERQASLGWRFAATTLCTFSIAPGTPRSRRRRATSAKRRRCAPVSATSSPG